MADEFENAVLATIRQKDNPTAEERLRLCNAEQSVKRRRREPSTMPGPLSPAELQRLDHLRNTPIDKLACGDRLWLANMVLTEPEQVTPPENDVPRALFLAREIAQLTKQKQTYYDAKRFAIASSFDRRIAMLETELRSIMK